MITKDEILEIYDNICKRAKELATKGELIPTVFAITDDNVYIYPLPPIRNDEEKDRKYFLQKNLWHSSNQEELCLFQKQEHG